MVKQELSAQEKEYDWKYHEIYRDKNYLDFVQRY